jgi:phosphatidylglycerol---prolipoprotein diacylglyceryl transferase
VIAAIGWPVLDRIHIGPLSFSPHGLGIAIGFLVGAWLLGRIGPARGITLEQVNSIMFWSIVGAIIGARLFYVIAHHSEFSNVGEMLAVWRGGISLLGGIAGATLINIPFVRKRGQHFFQVADPIAICLALGIAIGRIGDLVIGDHLGKPTGWLLSWQYRGGNLPPPWQLTSPSPTQWVAPLTGGYTETFSRTAATLCIVPASGNQYSCAGQPIVATGIGVHQTALYDMILVWILFLILWRLSRSPRRMGILTLTFGLYYGIARLLEDSLRIDKRFGPLTGSQWTALTVAVVSAVVLVWWAFHPKPDVDTPSDDEPPERAPGTAASVEPT